MQRGRGDSPPVALGLHGVGDLDKASDVGTRKERGEDTVGELFARPLGASAQADAEALSHNVLELSVDLLCGPGEALAILRHLETGNSDTTAVGRFPGGVPDTTRAGLAGSLEDIDGLDSAAHVGALSYDADTGLDESLGLLAGNLVLGSTRESDVNGRDESPGALACSKMSESDTMCGSIYVPSWYV